MGQEEYMSSKPSSTMPSGPGRPPPGNSPRTSDIDSDSKLARETPWRTLHQLANIPRPTTPLRRASSAGPPSARPSAHRTPAGQFRTPKAAARLNGSARRQIAVTPHGRAAQRELDLRRAGLTPGKDRRRSGRQQRETPRDILRQLSRHLAPKTHPTVPTPQRLDASTSKPRRVADEDDSDDGIELERPRLSLPADADEDEDEDDSLLLPPKSAGLEDENFTLQSIELPRRAISETPYRRFSRGSFGSIRMSNVFADPHENGPITQVDDSSYLVGARFLENDEDMEDDTLAGGNTGTLRELGMDRGRVPFVEGLDSDIRPPNLRMDDTENTFMFTVPPRDDVGEIIPGGNPRAFLIDDESFEEQAQGEMEDQWGEEVDEEPKTEILMALGPSQQSHADVDDGSEFQGELIYQKVPVSSRAKKRKKVSKHGIPYPSLPPGVIKKLATSFVRTSGSSKAKVGKEALDAIVQASDWFFEQIGDDLGTYAHHAGRKTIDESDIVTLMARQRQTNTTTTPFSLAQKYLPRELLQDLRMVPPPSKLGRGTQLDRVDE